jgi:hypothetical protein
MGYIDVWACRQIQTLQPRNSTSTSQIDQELIFHVSCTDLLSFRKRVEKMLVKFIIITTIKENKPQGYIIFYILNKFLLIHNLF